MIAIVHSLYSQSVHARALNAGLMDNDIERTVYSPPNQRMKRVSMNMISQKTLVFR